jgi:hypothetical protein
MILTNLHYIMTFAVNKQVFKVLSEDFSAHDAAEGRRISRLVGFGTLLGDGGTGVSLCDGKDRSERRNVYVISNAWGFKRNISSDVAQRTPLSYM